MEHAKYVLIPQLLWNDMKTLKEHPELLGTVTTQTSTIKIKIGAFEYTGSQVQINPNYDEYFYTNEDDLGVLFDRSQIDPYLLGRSKIIAEYEISDRCAGTICLIRQLPTSIPKYTLEMIMRGSGRKYVSYQIFQLMSN